MTKSVRKEVMPIIAVPSVDEVRSFYVDRLAFDHVMGVVGKDKLQWWGDKTFKVKDPNGYEIWFYQTVSEPKPPEGAKIV